LIENDIVAIYLNTIRLKRTFSHRKAIYPITIALATLLSSNQLFILTLYTFQMILLHYSQFYQPKILFMSGSISSLSLHHHLKLI
jgi:hypothetical protein